MVGAQTRHYLRLQPYRRTLSLQAPRHGLTPRRQQPGIGAHQLCTIMLPYLAATALSQLGVFELICYCNPVKECANLQFTLNLYRIA